MYTFLEDFNYTQYAKLVLFHFEIGFFLVEGCLTFYLSKVMFKSPPSHSNLRFSAMQRGHIVSSIQMLFCSRAVRFS